MSRFRLIRPVALAGVGIASIVGLAGTAGATMPPGSDAPGTEMAGGEMAGPSGPLCAAVPTDQPR